MANETQKEGWKIKINGFENFESRGIEFTETQDVVNVYGLKGEPIGIYTRSFNPDLLRADLKKYFEENAPQ